MLTSTTSRISPYERFLRYIPFFWMLLSLLTALAEVMKGPGAINNYHIYTGVYWHFFEQKNLYLSYPLEYFDKNLYGPLFAFLIAPFALMNVGWGCVLWCLLNSIVLLYAILRMPLDRKKVYTLAAIVLIENLTSLHNVEFNTMLSGWILLSFILIRKEQLFWGVFLIVAGFLIKVYSIVGLAFFFFTPQKIKFACYTVFWMIALLLFPMLFASPEYVLSMYQEWLKALVIKNDLNLVSKMQDLSVSGMFRRIFSGYEVSNLWFLIPAMFLTLGPLAFYRNWRSSIFQGLFLAQILIGLVIFSSSSESPTYVIAVTGAALWWVLQNDSHKFFNLILVLLLFFLTILSPTDLFPSYLDKKIVEPYALKVFPCFIIWVIVTLQLYFPVLRLRMTVEDFK